MDGDFDEALRQIVREKEVSLESLVETVETALVTAYKKANATQGGEISVRFNPQNMTFRVFCQKVVVEELGLTEDGGEILLSEAVVLFPGASVGETVEIDVTPRTYGRIAAQTAKQVMVQRLREAERDRVFDEYNDRVGEVVTGVVQRREYKNILINIGKLDAILPPQEQVESEPYRFNDRIKVYIHEVRRTPRGPQVIVSRTHPSLIRRLFELEVPEVADGIVLIKSVAREPGARSKIAVTSRDEKVDPVGSCVGHRGARVQAVVNELYDEKIDIIKWSPEISQFIAEALSPAEVVSVDINDDGKSAFVIVPDNQLSLAIGKAGQNVRLAARLTQWRIDIRSESQVNRARTVETPAVAEDEAPAAVPIAEAVAEAPAEVPIAEAPAEPATAEAVAEAPAEIPIAEAVAEAPAEPAIAEAELEAPAAAPETEA